MKSVAALFLLCAACVAVSDGFLIARMMAKHAGMDVNVNKRMPSNVPVGKRDLSKRDPPETCWPDNSNPGVNDDMPTCCWYSSATCCTANSALGQQLDDLLQFQIAIAQTGLYNDFPDCYNFDIASSCLFCNPGSSKYLAGGDVNNGPNSTVLCQTFCDQAFSACGDALAARGIFVNNGQQICALIVQQDSSIRVEQDNVNCFIPAPLDTVKASPCTPTGAVWWVDPATGSDANIGDEMAPFASFQQAVVSSNNGDTIKLVGGIYKGSLNIGVQVDKTVHVLSVNGTAIFQCANPTSDTGIELTYNGMGSTIEGIGIANCDNGMMIYNAVTIKNVTISKCVRGLHASQGELTVMNSVFTQNQYAVYSITPDSSLKNTFMSCSFDGGPASDSTSYRGIRCGSCGSVTVNNSVFSDMQDKTFYGSAILVEEADLALSRTTVRNCNSDAGVVVVNGVSKVSIQDCHFSQNSATSVAGALATSSSVVATVSGSTFSGNSGGAYGGGAYFAGQSIVNNCTFTGNTADSRGGGFACYSAAATVDLSFSNFTNNAAPQGSAYSCISGCTVVDDGNNILNGESANC